ncbi:MAG: PEP-CTERM sorting domain-containing protein [Chthonomonas sp.]|nr:PEP-CTERM sorting domain-containing protein [Chthonomonas sp.]
MNFNRIFTVVALVSVVGAAEARLPRNSYITRPTPTKESFIKLLNNEPVVMDRYMRHFAMTRSEVMAYMSQISLSTVKEGGLYTVYNVPAATGELRSKLLKMKKGEKIWVDRFGNPVMVVVCGNPMTRGPKTVVALDQSRRPLLTDTLESPVRVGDEEIRVESTPSPVAEAPEVVAFQPAMPTVETPVTDVVEPTRVVENASFSRRIGGAFLGLIPLAIIGTNRKSNPPVPEPASGLILAAGAGLFLARRKK